MSLKFHDCPPKRTRKSFLPDVTIIPGKVGWDLGVEEYGFQIRFCPFCGKDLETESQGTLCGDPPPSDQAPGLTGLKGVHVHGVERGPESPVTKWIYRYVHHLAEERRTAEEILNAHGQAGWELAYYKPTASGGHDLILKRPARSLSEGSPA